MPRIVRAGDADPGSLLRRRRRDSALPEARIPARPGPCLAGARRPSYGIPTLAVVPGTDQYPGPKGEELPGSLERPGSFSPHARMARLPAGA